ncbi:unnamed protein product [Bursaphelenchus xylophilus]|uniref:dTCF n=1 Tax=Bursaphelenchus xylophilus TaxID=6326 RepID=A0A1I7SC08_BURXY|nr:unnamed protein product [Bursaphelenchus xylophilus]CAG9086375.1 unnamed protein product [Bursaphelenchus xylophilus]
MTSMEETDEVKVFRNNNDPEEVVDTPQSSQQLSDDKKEVAFETELEGQNINLAPFADLQFKPHTPIGTLSPAFLCPLLAMKSPHTLLSPGFQGLNFASPNYGVLSPNFMPIFNPFYNMQNMQMHNLLKQSLPMANMTNNMAGLGMLNPGVRYPSSTPSTPRRDKGVRIEKDKNRIKKPCNAFMIFMRENRAQVAKENHCKQSSELNKELGQRWQNLTKEEQEKYFDMARREKEDHAKQHPGWSARDNYAVHKKKKRSRRERSYDPTNENNEQKKCRARFGVDNQQKWCKHCKRKKRCLNVQDLEVSSTTNPSTPLYLHSSPNIYSPLA